MKYVQAALPLEEGEDSHAMRALWQTPTPSRRQPRPDRPRLPGRIVFGQRKAAEPVELRTTYVHRSHVKRDRKRTAHVWTSIIERVSHRIRRLLSARVCRLLNVCLRRLSIGSESHLTVA